MGSARATYNFKCAIHNKTILKVLETRLNIIRKITDNLEKINERASLVELKIRAMGIIRSEIFLQPIISDYLVIIIEIVNHLFS